VTREPNGDAAHTSPLLRTTHHRLSRSQDEAKNKLVGSSAWNTHHTTLYRRRKPLVLSDFREPRRIERPSPNRATGHAVHRSQAVRVVPQGTQSPLQHIATKHLGDHRATAPLVQEALHCSQRVKPSQIHHIARKQPIVRGGVVRPSPPESRGLVSEGDHGARAPAAYIAACRVSLDLGDSSMQTSTADLPPGPPRFAARETVLPIRSAMRHPSQGRPSTAGPATVPIALALTGAAEGGRRS
jgi:hypothetical protein